MRTPPPIKSIHYCGYLSLTVLCGIVRHDVQPSLPFVGSRATIPWKVHKVQWRVLIECCRVPSSARGREAGYLAHLHYDRGGYRLATSTRKSREDSRALLDPTNNGDTSIGAHNTCLRRMNTMMLETNDCLDAHTDCLHACLLILLSLKQLSTAGQ